MSAVGLGPRGRAVLVAVAFATQLATTTCRSGPAPVATSTPPAAPAAAATAADDAIVTRGILRRDGERIVDATGQPVRWRGVAFGNQANSASTARASKTAAAA
jgi:hypothetical protein